MNTLLLVVLLAGVVLFALSLRGGDRPAVQQERILWLESRVAQLERQVAYLTDALGVQESDIGDLNAPHMDEIRALLEKGQKINAIKVYRQQFNVGLKDAKDAVEAMQREIRL
ncbi:MAG: ribosomal protein L7/L12 [Anaerolineales bacterium]